MSIEAVGEFTLREFRPDDLPAMVDLINSEYPDEPTTLEQEQHWEDIYPPQNPRLRLAVETPHNRLIGFGLAIHPYWMTAAGVYECFAVVALDWRRRGIGNRLFAELQPYAQAQGATRLWASARESQDHTIAWLAQAGFSQYGLRFESALDLKTFEPDQFAGARDRAVAAGYRFSTLAEQRAVRAEADRALFEVYRDAIADCPLPGGAIITPEWEIWQQGLGGPTFDPAFVFVALHGEAIVAMTQVDLLANAPAVTSATAVLREHRGHSLATALKVESLRGLQRRGYAEARTHNDTANPSIVHINRKLGYTRLPGWTMWEKPL